MRHELPYIFDVDEAGFPEQVLAASGRRPVLVDFWAEWCAPCISLEPALKQAVREYEGGILLAKVEVDDNMRLAGRYRLRGFPTVMLFHQGEEISRFSGTRPVHWIRDWLEQEAGPYLA